MKNISLTIKNNFWMFLAYFLLPLGGVWAFIEPTAFVFGDFISMSVKIFLYLILLFSGLGYSIFKLKPLNKIELMLEHKRIIIRFGDIFESKDTFKVIPVSQFFYETQVVKTSLQNKLIEIFKSYDQGNLGLQTYFKLLDEGLKDYEDEIKYETRNFNDDNLNIKYPIGTTIKFQYGTDKYMLFALTKTEMETVNVPLPPDNCNVSLLWQALEIFWEKASVIAKGDSISIPLIGNHVNGINLNPFLTLEINLLAILYALKSRKLNLYGNQHIEIILYDKDLSLLKDIDLKKVKEIWESKLH